MTKYYLFGISGSRNWCPQKKELLKDGFSDGNAILNFTDHGKV